MSSKTTSSIARSELGFRAPDGERPLAIVRSGRARRMRIAVDARDGRVRLTLPARASLAAGLAWAESKRNWIEALLARLESPVAIAPGASIPYAGTTLSIDWDPAAGRTIARDGASLRLGGARESVERRVVTWLKREALATLDAESRAVAARAGVPLGRVTVGDPRTRWGSCSSSGNIRYSWRLIMAPPAVLSATVAHEVAHRLHMHHGPAFHAAVAALLGREPVAETRWLREHGGALHRIGLRQPGGGG